MGSLEAYLREAVRRDRLVRLAAYAVLTPEGRADTGTPRLLIDVYPRQQANLDGATRWRRWKASCRR